MLAASALTALDLMERRPQMFSELKEKCLEAHNAFEGLKGLSLHGERFSPVKHLRLREPKETREQDRKVLDQVVVKVKSRGWGVLVQVRSDVEQN